MTEPFASDGSTSNYTLRVGKALDAAFDRVKQTDAPDGDMKVLHLTTDRYIIFSDQHRGARNGADDFQRAERAYNAALAYYLRKGYTLVVLGDVEELWEEKPAAVIKAYQHTLELEAQFHQRGRYIRIWGNHDDEWQYESSVYYHLGKVYGGSPLQVHEGICLKVVDGAEELGTLFLIHGHQGDVTSDQWSWLSRFVIRYIWRTFQRLTRISLNTPANSWDLRKKHQQALYTWAEKQEKLILVAGHTHHPVFKSRSHEAQLKEKLAELESTVADPPTTEQLEALSALLAQLEWVRAQGHQRPHSEQSLPMHKPCYFDTGCCCFLDGDITGIEIAHGKIRLVRWPNENRKPRLRILIEDSLRAVLMDC